MRPVLYIMAPVPVGALMIIVENWIAGIFPDNWPIFFWNVIAASFLVGFVYIWYKCWRTAFEEVFKKYL